VFSSELYDDDGTVVFVAASAPAFAFARPSLLLLDDAEAFAPEPGDGDGDVPTVLAGVVAEEGEGPREGPLVLAGAAPAAAFASARPSLLLDDAEASRINVSRDGERSLAAAAVACAVPRDAVAFPDDLAELPGRLLGAEGPVTVQTAFVFEVPALPSS
jgi:hypothetical protein